MAGDIVRARGTSALGIVAVAVGALAGMATSAAAKGDVPVAMVTTDDSLWIAHSGGLVERRDLGSGLPDGSPVRAGLTVRALEGTSGRLWALTTVAHDGRATWLRPISPGGGRAIALPGGPYCDLAASGDALVAVSCSGRRLVRIVPSARSVTVLRAPPGRVTDAVQAGERLWLALRRPRIAGRNRGTALVPVDPLTGSPSGGAVGVGRHGAMLAAARGTLWAASGDGRLTALDVDTGRIASRAVVGMRPHDLAAEGEEVWIAASRLGGQGTLIAVAGGRRREVRLGRSGTPLQIAVAAGTVWAAGYRFTRDGLQPRLWRADAARARLVAPPEGPGEGAAPQAAAVPGHPRRSG